MHKLSRVVGASALLSMLIPIPGMAAVVVAWDFSDQRQPGIPTPGWTTISTTQMVNTGSTVNGITIELTDGGLDIDDSGHTNQFPGGITFVEDAIPLISLAANGNAEQRIYEDWFGDVRRDDPTYTISGLTPDLQYTFQFVASFNAAEQITVEQDGVLQLPIQSSGDAAAGNIVYSSYYTFMATPGDTDVAFTFDGATSGNAPQYGLSGLVIDAIPEPSALGLLAVGILAGLGERRRTVSQKQKRIQAEQGATPNA